MEKRLKFYGENTTVHGLRYVVDDRSHVFIRILWGAVFITSTYCMFLIFRGSYESYNNNSISFVTETTYLDWNTTFPAVSICEVTSSEVFWTPEPGEDYSPIHQFISDIIFFTGNCYSCTADCEQCLKLDLLEITRRFRKKCSMLMRNCKWNDIHFDCCEQFLPIETEYGVCFAINSLHSHKTKKKEIALKSNRKTGPGQLWMELLEDVRVYFHAPEDVPFINSVPDQRKDVQLGARINITLKVTEIENDENLKYLPVAKRECRFPWEITDDMRVHEYYSYSTCIVQCHAQAHMDLCNCTHHLMPVLGKEKHCGIEGLQCLTENYEVVNRLHADGYHDKPGLVCNCVPSCVEPEYKVVADREEATPARTSEIILKMQSLPTSRFRRTVVRSTMDLVVSIGGNAGLFIGASLLSIIEVPYMLIFRK